MIDKLRRVILVSRPVSWLNTAYPFAAGYLVAGGDITPTLFIGTLFFLIPYNLLMYGINDVFDYESDIRNPRKGGIEGMREERALHPLIFKASIIGIIPFILYMLLTGSFTSKIVLVVLVFFVVAYSVRGLRFKEIPLLDSVTSSIHFVGPLVYALSLVSFSLAAWPVVIAFFAWGMASHAFGAVQDIIPDRQGGLKSIATFFGSRATVWLCIVLYTIAVVVVASIGIGGIIVAGAGLLYVANIIPYARITDATSSRANKGWRRFIWLNLIAGFVVTMVLIYSVVFVH